MLIYILKSSACLAIFFVFYKLFLERENMHIFKRFYLLASSFVSFIIPLITFISYTKPDQESINQNILLTEVISQRVKESLFDLSFILWSIYGIGLIIFGIIFVKNLSQILLKVKNNPRVKIGSITNVLLLDLIIPHTFFNYIFLNKQKFENREIPKEVLLHEQTHAKQKHSIDILIIEVLQVVFWFNPLIYFIKHAVKLNHEFLADQAVLQKGINTSVYQKILLTFTSNSSHIQLVNAINYSLLKKRLTIMKTRTSKNAIWLRSLVLLPLLAVLIYGFSSKVTIEKEVPNSKVINEITLQKKATPEQVAEYNKLAKYYNAQSKSNLRIKLKDVKRLEYIYSLMTEAQKKNAEPFPDFPPPPPTPQPSLDTIPDNVNSKKIKVVEGKYITPKEEMKVVIGRKISTPDHGKIIEGRKVGKTEKNVKINKVQPPPPSPSPIPASTTPKLEKTHKIPPPPNSSKPDTIHEVNGWKVTGVSNDIPPPPLPKDATYYINGKKASLKQVKDLDADDIIRMEVNKKNSKETKVYITTKQ